MFINDRLQRMTRRDCPVGVSMRSRWARMRICGMGVALLQRGGIESRGNEMKVLVGVTEGSGALFEKSFTVEP